MGILRKIDNFVDRAADLTIKAQDAGKTKRGQTLRGKAVETVKQKLPSTPAKCSKGHRIGRNGTCGKTACIREEAAKMDHIHTVDTNGNKIKPTGKHGRRK